MKNLFIKSFKNSLNINKSFNIPKTFTLTNNFKKQFSFKVNDFLTTNKLERDNDNTVDTDIVIVGNK